MDIEKFFNSVNHERLIEILSKRIEDGHFLRLIRRMLRNSILSEDGEIRATERGTPQGAPISPILANIYLHFCLDTWFDENWAIHGQMVRYADDAVFVFTHQEKAEEFKEALKIRLQEFGNLALNEDKSGILKFDSRKPEGELPFLGFNLYWGKAGRNGKSLLKVKTAPKKLANAMAQFSDWIKANRGRKKLDDLWDLAAAKLRGHYSYYGVSFNHPKLNHFYFACTQALFKWLNRRSQKRSFTWERFSRRLMFKPLPKPTPGAQLIDITRGLVTESKHQTRSRMRKLRTYGSNRSPGLSPVFT
jgi:RNA-directed DNA polymerase